MSHAKRISVIGAGGRMGRWFANYFHQIGFEIKGYDMENELKEKFIEKGSSLVGAILNIDYVILCTPTKKTPEIIRLFLKK